MAKLEPLRGARGGRVGKDWAVSRHRGAPALHPALQGKEQAEMLPTPAVALMGRSECRGVEPRSMTINDKDDDSIRSGYQEVALGWRGNTGGQLRGWVLMYV